MIVSGQYLLEHAFEMLVLGLIMYLFLLPIFAALWLWLRYDRRIKELRDSIAATPKRLNDEARGRGITADGLKPYVDAALRPLEIELKSFESQRQAFLDRINLILKFKLF
jgi:hypothetical protein